MTRNQITHRDDGTVLLRIGRGEITIPEPLAGLLLELRARGRPYVGVG